MKQFIKCWFYTAIKFCSRLRYFNFWRKVEHLSLHRTELKDNLHRCPCTMWKIAKPSNLQAHNSHACAHACVWKMSRCWILFRLYCAPSPWYSEQPGSILLHLLFRLLGSGSWQTLSSECSLCPKNKSFSAVWCFQVMDLRRMTCPAFYLWGEETIRRCGMIDDTIGRQVQKNPDLVKAIRIQYLLVLSDTMPNLLWCHIYDGVEFYKGSLDGSASKTLSCDNLL